MADCDERADVAAADAGAAGKAEAYPGWVGETSVEVHVYEDALLVITDGRARRLGFSFVDRVTVEDYAVEVALSGGESVLISRLGHRAVELASLAEERLRESRGRTAAFLGSLLPGLDPVSAHSAAALLRDGVAVPAHSLDAIHPEVTATLLRVATNPERFAVVAALAQHADLAIGFKQGLGASGNGGQARFADPGAYWAYQALGTGVNWNASPAGSARQMMHLADVQRGILTPPSEDLAALTTSGSEPTVLAFALFASSRGRVAYDMLNLPEPVTYVYEADGDARTVINRALDDAGFQAAAVHAAADGSLVAASRTDAPAVLLARSLVAQVPHNQDWERQIAALLS